MDIDITKLKTADFETVISIYSEHLFIWNTILYGLENHFLVMGKICHMNTKHLKKSAHF